MSDLDFHNIYIKNPNFETLGYIIGIANIQDKHDRSAPSDYHWKILKCRMIIFSNSCILACPDKNDLKQIHIVFNKTGDDYDKINSMFLKFSLAQDGPIRTVTPEIFTTCFQYTMTARLAPVWNVLGNSYLINNRDFLIIKGAQDAVIYQIKSNAHFTTIDVKPTRVYLQHIDDNVLPGEYVRVLPSLNKAMVEEYCENLPIFSVFKSYKDLRRHWKNIHGYRLPEEECLSYYLIRFWRGDPLTYPKQCLNRNYPIVTPMPKQAGKIVLSKFINCLKNKMSNILGTTLTFLQNYQKWEQVANENFEDTPEISLCTPSQLQIRHTLDNF